MHKNSSVKLLSNIFVEHKKEFIEIERTLKIKNIYNTRKKKRTSRAL